MLVIGVTQLLGSDMEISPYSTGELRNICWLLAYQFKFIRIATDSKKRGMDSARRCSDSRQPALTALMSWGYVASKSKLNADNIDFS